MIIDGSSPQIVLKELQELGVKVTEKTLKTHLKNHGIEYPAENKIIRGEAINIDLNKIDFSQYDFDLENPDSVIDYIQKINLKIYLNQALITLKAQQEVLCGNSMEVSKYTFQNLAIAFQILSKSTGLEMTVDQQKALKTVEAMGLTIKEGLPLLNVQNNSESKTN